VPSSPIYEPVAQDYPVYASIEQDGPVYANRLPDSPVPIEAGIFFPVGAGFDVEPPINFINLTAQSLSATPATAIIGVTPSPPVYTPLNTTLPTPLTANYKGFPGQFLGPTLNTLAAKTKMGAMKKPKVTVFGDRLHANGTIIHKECFPAPATPIWNYTPETLSRHSTLFRALEDMDLHNELASSEQVTMLRAVSQEDLRNEAHRELASARLEGVCVGQYRYYQGHLSVEEYVNKGLCVCWSPCACSRVCSRYGDVICPCSGDLELETDSESEGE
jgi:hypothetical protein